MLRVFVSVVFTLVLANPAAARSRKRVKQPKPKPRPELRVAAKRCHEMAVKETGPVAGKVTVRVTLAHNGDVLRGEIAQSTLLDEGLTRCLHRSLPATRVTEGNSANLPRSPASVLLPIVFAGGPANPNGG